MTSEELEAEREEQIARGEMPRYGGKHAHLTKKNKKHLKQKVDNQVFALECHKIKNINSMISLKVKYHLIQMVSVTG